MMSLWRKLQFSGIAALLVTATTIAQHGRALSGFVESLNGTRQPGVEIRVTNVGSCVSSDSGEFTVALPPKFLPGDRVELYALGQWVITSPYEGVMYLPNRPTESVRIRVSRKGDPKMLADSALIQSIVGKGTSQFGPSASLAEFLLSASQGLGVSVEQLRGAIDKWSQNPDGPYQAGLASLYAKRYSEASQQIEQAISISESGLLDKYLSLASAEYHQGHYSKAESALIKATAIEPSNPRIQNNLGLVLSREGKYDQGEATLRSALTANEEASSVYHHDLFANLTNLGTLYSCEGKYTDAGALFEKALAFQEERFGKGTPEVVSSLNNLAASRAAQGDYTRAESLLKQGLTICDRTASCEKPVTASLFQNWAVLARNQCRYSEAENLAKKALDLEEGSPAPNPSGRANALLNLANIYRVQGRFAEAEPLFEKAFSLAESASGPDDPSLADIAENMSMNLHGLGRDAEAERYEVQALRIRAKWPQMRVFRPQINDPCLR